MGNSAAQVHYSCHGISVQVSGWAIYNIPIAMISSSACFNCSAVTGAVAIDVRLIPLDEAVYSSNKDHVHVIVMHR